MFKSLTWEQFVERFESRFEPVTESGCWIWMAGYRGDDYRGYACHEKKHDLAYRWAYRIYKGEIPLGMQINHRCNVPSCVNPDHLYAGTQAQNIGDCIKSGRRAIGSKHGMAKLSESQAADIKNNPTMPRKVLADRHGVSVQTIKKIRAGALWGHV